MSGLLVGILLSTSLAGLFSNLFHWKVVYAISGILMLLLVYTLKSRLPYVMRMKLNYGQIFVSMAQLLKRGKATFIKSAYRCIRLCVSKYSIFHHRITSHLGTSFTRSIYWTGTFSWYLWCVINTLYRQICRPRLHTFTHLDGLRAIFSKLDLFLFRTNSTFSLCYWFCFNSIGTCPCPHQQPKYYFPFTSRC